MHLDFVAIGLGEVFQGEGVANEASCHDHSRGGSTGIHWLQTAHVRFENRTLGDLDATVLVLNVNVTLLDTKNTIFVETLKLLQFRNSMKSITDGKIEIQKK